MQTKATQLITVKSICWITCLALVWHGPPAFGFQIPRPVDPASLRSMPNFNVPPIQPGVAYERFMVIGDMGTGREDQYKVAAGMAKRATREKPNFVLTVGDNFYENGVASVDDPQWKTKFEDVYKAAALQVPFYASLGNHDHRGSVEAQIEYGRHNARWNMPAPFYTFTRTLADKTKIQFFAIDSNPIHNRSHSADEQLKWLNEELGRSSARWKIVFGHHPLYSHSIRSYDQAMIDQLEPLLIKHKVDLYLAGHDHTLEMHKPVSGVNYVVTGAGAGPDKAYPVRWTDQSFYAATLGGFTAYRISRNECVVEFLRLDGLTQYAYTITKP